MSDIVAGGGKSSDIIFFSSRIFHKLVFGAETMKGGGDL